MPLQKKGEGGGAKKSGGGGILKNKGTDATAGSSSASSTTVHKTKGKEAEHAAAARRRTKRRDEEEAGEVKVAKEDEDIAATGVPGQEDLDGEEKNDDAEDLFDAEEEDEGEEVNPSVLASRLRDGLAAAPVTNPIGMQTSGMITEADAMENQTVKEPAEANEKAPIFSMTGGPSSLAVPGPVGQTRAPLASSSGAADPPTGAKRSLDRRNTWSVA